MITIDAEVVLVICGHVFPVIRIAIDDVVAIVFCGPNSSDTYTC